MLGSACVRVVGHSSRRSWTRENAGESPCRARPGRCRPTRFNGGGCAVGGAAGLVGDSAEVVRLGDAVVAAGPGLGLRNGLGLANGPASVGLGDTLGDGPATVGLGDGPATVGLGDGPLTVGLGDGPLTVGLGDGPLTVGLGDAPGGGLGGGQGDGPVTVGFGDTVGGGLGDALGGGLGGGHAHEHQCRRRCRWLRWRWHR
jgi:hypothetical protein